MSIPRLLHGREGAGRLSGKRRARRRGRVGAPLRSASASTSPALSDPPPRLWLASPHSSLVRALPKYGTAMLRGHPARASCRARPAAVGGPSCPAEPAPPGGALRAPRLLLPVRAEGDQAAHAEDAGVLDAGGIARTGLPSPAVPASSAPDIPGPPCWDILVSTISKMLRWPIPPGLASHSGTVAGYLGGVPFPSLTLTLNASGLAP